MTSSNIIDDGARKHPAGYGSQKRGLKSLKRELKQGYGFNNVHGAAWVVSCSGEWHLELAGRVDEVNHPQGLCSQRGDELCGLLVPGSGTHAEYTLAGLWRHPGGVHITEHSCKASVHSRVSLCTSGVCHFHRICLKNRVFYYVLLLLWLWLTAINLRLKSPESLKNISLSRSVLLYPQNYNRLFIISISWDEQKWRKLSVLFVRSGHECVYLNLGLTKLCKIRKMFDLIIYSIT